MASIHARLYPRPEGLGFTRAEDKNNNSLTDFSNLQSYQKEMEELSNKINEKSLKKDELKNYIESGINASGRPLTEKQGVSFREKLKSLEDALEKLKNKESILEDKINELEDDLKDFNSSEARNEIEQLQDDILRWESEQKLEEENLNRILSERKECEAKISQQEDIISKVEQKMADNFAKKVMELNNNEMASSLDLDILPDTHYKDVWPEAAKIQDEFDKEATNATGSIVKNGQKLGGMNGSNVRSILLFVDDNLNKVQEIDVLDLFKDKIGFSKLSEFNNVSNITNPYDLSIKGVKGTVRPLLPLTTELDEVRYANRGSKYTIDLMNKMVADNAHFYEQLKRVFKNKFKFTKKDFWRGAQEEGSFDSRNLWKLPTRQGDDYYEVCNPKYINKVAASILVDTSGSNDKEITNYGEKIRELVLGLSLALDSVHIKHEVLGYEAPLSEEMRALNASDVYARRSNFLRTTVYKDAKQKTNDSIMNMEISLADNSDGESLRVAVERLKKLRAKSHILFLISDGKPFLTDTDISVLDEDLKSALVFAKKNKVVVLGLGFFDNLREFLGNNFCDAQDKKNVLKFFNDINLRGVLK